MKNKIQAVLQQIIKLELFAIGLTGQAKNRLKEEIENLKLDVRMMTAKCPLVAALRAESTPAVLVVIPIVKQVV